MFTTILIVLAIMALGALTGYLFAEVVSDDGTMTRERMNHLSFQLWCAEMDARHGHENH